MAQGDKKRTGSRNKQRSQHFGYTCNWKTLNKLFTKITIKCQKIILTDLPNITKLYRSHSITDCNIILNPVMSLPQNGQQMSVDIFSPLGIPDAIKGLPRYDDNPRLLHEFIIMWKKFCSTLEALMAHHTPKFCLEPFVTKLKNKQMRCWAPTAHL